MEWWMRIPTKRGKSTNTPPIPNHNHNHNPIPNPSTSPPERNKTNSPKSLPTAPASVPANMTGNTGKIHAGVIPPTLNLLSTFLTTNNK